MVEFVVLGAIVVLAFVFPTDPAPGGGRSRAQSRNLDCERVSIDTASERYPGRFVRSASRATDDSDRTVVVCAERLTRPGLRAERDEAILTTLDATATELATAAESLRPELAGKTWLVEAYDPSPAVASKVSFAAKTALMGRGLSVSDRTPTLGPADIDVITRMAPDQAYPAACTRYFGTGGLGDDDVLLAVVRRDPRETLLHAGVCTGGQWAWLK
ncbi:MAG: hypothetical protein ABMB14_17200 [Myxococcota bacterium]